MLKLKRTGRFKKDYKLMQRRGKDMGKLKEVIKLLIQERPIGEKYQDHPLIGNWIGTRNCHIEPDWILIYTKINNEVILERTGTHSDLFRSR